jgi:carboxylesterase
MGSTTRTGSFSDMSTPAVLPEAEPMSQVGSTRTGVLVIHGFTGNPSSMRGIAEAMAALGHHVEMPRLPGHGTTVDDMVGTRWADWTGEVRAAHGRLADRVDEIVVVGLSMGGAITLWSGFELPNVVGLVAINPATAPQAPEVVEMLQEMVDDGTEIAPAIGGDIADPDVQESSYDGAPLRALLSFMTEGLVPITERYGELTMPLLLITSRQDHVVEPANSEHLAATYGGDVEHVWLERSYHVATQDYDAADIERMVSEFVARVTAS